MLWKLNKISAYEIKWLLPALKSLCEGKPAAQASKTSLSTSSSSISSVANLSATLLQFDYTAVAALLRNTKYPEAGKTIVTSSDKDSPKSEIKRSRSDLSSVILQQLTSPLEAGKIAWAPLSEELTDCTEIFASANVAYLQSLNGADNILDMCMNLHSLTRYRLKYQETISAGGTKPLYLPLTQAEATQIKGGLMHIVTDISILWQALSLPILQPLTPSRIVKLSKCAISALYCGVLASIACSVLSMTGGATSGAAQKSQQTTSAGSAQTTTKDSTNVADDSEEQARFIVDKALEIYTMIAQLFKNNARSHVYQNHLCFGAWLLVSGIQGALGASGSNVSGSNKSVTAAAAQPQSPQQQQQQQQAAPAQQTASEDVALKSKASGASGQTRTPDTPTTAPTARVNLFKVQQGFGVLNVAIANHCIKLLSELIDDLKIEATSNDAANALLTKEPLPEAANFDILENYTSLQRMIRVLNTATLHQLFTFLATVAYRKACALKRANAKDRTECEAISYSDSTTYFNDTLSCSDNSEEDDSESYLGNWFKETLSPEANEDATNASTQAQERINELQKSNLVGDEPHEYLDLAAQIFSFLDQFFANKHSYLHRYVKAGLSEQQMLLLANILKDLDRDAARGEPEVGVCAKWQGAMMRFSGAVGRYLHNLISASLLSESLQSNLLQNLSVSPWSTESNAWPLQVYPSTLSVLVQILLLKPTQEKEAACLWVWHRLINTLVEGVCATSVTSTAADTDYEDLNMEHAQLLLFLFHSLNLMQKKSILLLTAGGVIRCAEVCRGISAERPVRNSQIMSLSRLLLFLEYLMKHLYNAPPELLDQVRWNLFSVSTMSDNQKLSDFYNNKTKLTSFCHKDVEERFRKLPTEYNSNIRPTFYSLTLIDATPSQEFKLDGLAWNFILCTPDKLKYPLLVDALIDILAVVDMSKYAVNTHALCAMQYCFSICWKLLLGLPPSTQHVEALIQPVTPNLHSLLWSIRCAMSTAKYLISSSLIKQGMYTQFAENLWSSVCEQVSDMRFSLRQTLLGVTHFVGIVQKEQPTLSQIMLLDALVAHMQALAYAEKENLKPQRVAANNNGSSTASPANAAASATNTGAVEKDAPAAMESAEQHKSKECEEQLASVADLSRDLLQQLIDAFNAISALVRSKMTEQLTDDISSALLELIIPIVGKNPMAAEVNSWFLKLLNDHDREVVNSEWQKCLQVSESVFNGQGYPVEEYTLIVIEAHVQELTQSNSSYGGYSPLNSLKHCLFSILSLINYLLPLCESSSTDKPPMQLEQLKTLLVGTMLDMRLSYLYDISECCMQTLLQQKALAQLSTNTDAQLCEYTLQHCYRLMLALCEEMRQSAPRAGTLMFAESMLYAVLRALSQLLDSVHGLKAMHQFFSVRAEGSLVELLLCFVGTTMSLAYVRDHLLYVEKLFQLAEQADSAFPLNDLVACFADLAQVEDVRIKAWLSHVIYGSSLQQLAVGAVTAAPAISESADKVAPSSTPSSNAQTPTNMATVSAMPSIGSDQLAQSSGLDAEAMEIDDEGVVVCVPPPAVQQPRQQTLANIWQNIGGGSSYVTNHSEQSSPEHEPSTERNGALLLKVIKHIVGDGKSLPGVAMLLFQSLLQLGQSLIAPPHETADFADILQIMISLADTAQGRGHATLFNATIMWLEITKFQVLERALAAKSATGASAATAAAALMPQITLENITALLRYLSELLQSLGYKGSKVISPPWDDDMLLEAEESTEEALHNTPEDDEANADDYDEESLNNKLCTFSQTQKEFMNQHWYHCHTCNMVNTVGVCSVCARVCHKGHDVSYAKYGNFFCDCGAKEDGSCQALSRRVSSGTVALAETRSDYGTLLGGKKRATPPPPPPPPPPAVPQQPATQQNERIAILTKLLEASREQLQNSEQWSLIVRCILDFFDVLLPAIRENCALYAIVGCHKRAKTALERLHTPEQQFQFSDQLMVPTLGSQEGAFENVRMSYSGDQGQTIKQLLSSGLVRRVALCCLSSPHGKRQHLAVSHEKNKVTILQLSALLKQADAAKRKLTLTQLSSAPIPCTVLSLSANPANEDCLAVCGLKECHILTFASSGSTNEHIVLTPQLENGNFIKKAIWLPGSQTMLALVTADYVKIYELAEDAYSPKYYFLVAVGKIRDCTFVYQDGVYYMLLIASSGYIYYQTLDDQSLAKHGDFYVTNTLELNHAQIKDVSGQVGGGGISIYYSHTLQLLFFSYSMGRSFMAPLTDVNKGVKSITLLQTTPATKSASKGPPQPLCQWTEIAGHPGLICAMMHTSNNPVVFMLTPERIVMQEIKAQSSKARIMDMVAIRHTVSGVEKTTLILLCEDGSLRIFTAQPDATCYWLSPQVQPMGNQLYSSTLFAKCAVNKGKGKRKATPQQKTLGPNGNPVFPIDYFEHCTIMPDVEFGGNDLLQIYNKQKLKTRLFSSGMFVVSTKPTGFTLEIFNHDAGSAIVGVRVLLGTQDPLRAPQSVTILGRSVPTPVRRVRWFDIPLTREEILQSDKCLKLLFGKSQDPENVCMLDSIEVYVKSKDVLAWPDDNDEANTNPPVNATANGTSASSNNAVTAVAGTTSGQPTTVSRLASTHATNYGEGFTSITNLDKMVSNLLEVLDCALSLLGGSAVSNTIKQKATKTATTLLLLPTPAQVQLQTRYVLATLFGSRVAYYQYKDNEVLHYVHAELQLIKPKLASAETLRDIDPEAFYRLVLLVRSIATARQQALARICAEQQYDIVADLKACVEQLHQVTPQIDEPTSIVRRGLCHPEMIVHCLVEVIYAFALCDVQQVERMTKYLIDLLKNESGVISHSAKEALILLLGPRLKRRKVAIVTPPVCSTPTPAINSASVLAAASGAADEVLEAAAAVAAAGAGPPPVPPDVGRSNSAEYVDASPPTNEAGNQLLNMDAFMGLPQLLGLQQDADEEAIMDIAIALSLQQHDGEALQSLQQGLANLQGMRNASNLPAALEGANIANAASMSQGGSDDEGSNVATDGSTLRTSPAEAAGSGGSESGGSGVESIGGQSGRSSTYGDQVVASPPRSSGGNAPAELPSSSKSSMSGMGGAASVSSTEDANVAATSATPTMSGSVVGTVAAATTATSSCDNDDNDSDDNNLAKLHDLR